MAAGAGTAAHMSNARHVSETADRQPLTVWCGSAQYGAPVLRALARAYATDIRQTLPRPDEIGPGETGPGETGPDMLLLYLSPARVVATAMAQGTPADAALKDWQAQTRGILQLGHRDRRGVQVFELDMILRHPAAFRARMGLHENENEDENDTPAAPETGPGGADPFLLLLAQRTLLGDAPSRALMTELGAVSVRLANNAAPETDDPETLLLAYRDMQAQAATQAAVQTTRLNELEDELDQARPRLEAARNAAELLQAQTRFMQEEMEKLARRLLELEGRATRVETLTQRAAEKEHSLAAAGQMMRDLEAQTARLSADLAARDGRIAGLQGRLDHIFGSRSYRLTAPLRRLRALIGGAGPA